jgi:hypothetical protein
MILIIFAKKLPIFTQIITIQSEIGPLQWFPRKMPIFADNWSKSPIIGKNRRK